MCLGSYINRIPAEFLPTVPADTVFDRSSSEKPLHSCVRLHEIWTNVLVGSLLTGHMLQSVTTAAYSHFTDTQPTHKQDKTKNTLTPLTRTQEVDLNCSLVYTALENCPKKVVFKYAFARFTGNVFGRYSVTIGNHWQPY